MFLPARELSRLLKNVILLYYFLFSDKIRIKVRPNPLTVATGRQLEAWDLSCKERTY